MGAKGPRGFRFSCAFRDSLTLRRRRIGLRTFRTHDRHPDLHRNVFTVESKMVDEVVVVVLLL